LGIIFPLLFKYINAKVDLSIQLHPNDQLAKERHNSFGKAEMSYVLDADRNSKLILGFHKKSIKTCIKNTLQKIRFPKYCSMKMLRKEIHFL